MSVLVCGVEVGREAELEVEMEVDVAISAADGPGVDGAFNRWMACIDRLR